jgi:hypothetical protein
MFDVFAISANGGVSQTFENVEQMVTGMLFAGTIALAWGPFLLWRLGGMGEQKVTARLAQFSNSGIQ